MKKLLLATLVAVLSMGITADLSARLFNNSCSSCNTCEPVCEKSCNDHIVQPCPAVCCEKTVCHQVPVAPCVQKQTLCTVTCPPGTQEVSRSGDAGTYTKPVRKYRNGRRGKAASFTVKEEIDYEAAPAA